MPSFVCDLVRNISNSFTINCIYNKKNPGKKARGVSNCFIFTISLYYNWSEFRLKISKRISLETFNERKKKRKEDKPRFDNRVFLNPEHDNLRRNRDKGSTDAKLCVSNAYKKAKKFSITRPQARFTVFSISLFSHGHIPFVA